MKDYTILLDAMIKAVELANEYETGKDPARKVTESEVVVGLMQHTLMIALQEFLKDEIAAELAESEQAT